MKLDSCINDCILHFHKSSPNITEFLDSLFSKVNHKGSEMNLSSLYLFEPQFGHALHIVVPLVLQSLVSGSSPLGHEI